MTTTTNRVPAGVLLEVDGEVLDLADVVWQEVAPCGHICGLSSAFSPGGRMVVTAEQAMATFSESKREQQKSIRQGFTWRPRKWGVAHDEFRQECDHDPKYGITPRPEVEGKTWAVGGSWSERTSVLHLVDTPAVETEAYSPPYAERTGTAICGVQKRGWTNVWHVTDGKVECSRCEKKAAARAEVVSS